MKNVIVGIGEALWDVLPNGKKIGGAPANFAYIVSQLGLESVAISALGNDELGQELRENFDRKHLKYILPAVAYPTGTVEVQLNEEGIPCYDIKENVAWDNICRYRRFGTYCFTCHGRMFWFIGPAKPGFT